jgi:D-galactarolactone cycloisomerase
MKIKDVRMHVLEAALSQPFSWSLGWTGTSSALLVEVEAADGGARATARHGRTPPWSRP